MMPSTRKKVTEQMDQAKVDIENRLVPKGANVTRHLALPSDSKSLEWILQEMDKMDTEMGGSVESWREGKLSGAVYRKLSFQYSATVVLMGDAQMEETTSPRSSSPLILDIVYRILYTPRSFQQSERWRQKSLQCALRCTVDRRGQQVP